MLLSSKLENSYENSKEFFSSLRKIKKIARKIKEYQKKLRIIQLHTFGRLHDSTVRQSDQLVKNNKCVYGFIK